MDRTQGVLTSVLQHFVPLLWSHECMILCVDECLFNMGLLNLRFCVTIFYHTGLYNCYCYFIFQSSFFFVIFKGDVDRCK